MIKLECDLTAARSTLDTYDDEKMELLEENKKLRSEILLELAKGKIVFCVINQRWWLICSHLVLEHPTT